MRGNACKSSAGPTLCTNNCPALLAYLKVSSQEDWLQGIIHSEVETAIDDNADARNVESSVQSGDTITGQRLLVHV